MKLVDNIIKELNKNEISSSIFVDSVIPTEILTQYTHKFSGANWVYISLFQPISIDFIRKYIDKVWFNDLLCNLKIELPSDFIEENLYRFNLFVANYRLNMSNDYKHHEHIDIIRNLITKYQHKYEIDKLAYELIR